MFSSVRTFSKHLTRPSIILIDFAPCLHRQTRTRSSNVTNLSSNTVCCKLKAPQERLASSLLVCSRWLSTQQCHLGAATKRSTGVASSGGDGHVKSRPVRTENAGAASGERSREDGSASYRDEDERKGSIKEDERQRPDVMNSYAKAKERVQEQIDKVKDSKENIFTIPNLLTSLRIALSPVLGYLVIQEYYTLAASLFVFTSATDVLDGWIARKFPNQMSILGSIIDPLADKVLITVLTVSLTISGLIPVPLAFIILGRDVGLITSVFWLRYKTLTPPRTLSRYFDMTHTTVRLQPTTISKYNTLIQVALVGFTLGAPVFNYVDHPLLHGLWYVTATTTVLSGLSYVFLNNTYKIVKNGK